MTEQEKFYAAFGLYIKLHCDEYFNNDGTVDEEEQARLRVLSITGHSIREMLESSNFSYKSAKAKIILDIKESAQNIAREVLGKIEKLASNLDDFTDSEREKQFYAVYGGSMLAEVNRAFQNDDTIDEKEQGRLVIWTLGGWHAINALADNSWSSSKALIEYPDENDNIKLIIQDFEDKRKRFFN